MEKKTDRIFRRVETPAGRLTIVQQGGGIAEVRFEHEEIRDAAEADSALLREAGKQLEEYFQGVRREFALPLALQGTDFQKQVWEALLRIPYGETRTYGQIAAEIGRPKACRAVGMANHSNPAAIIVPCHRVIGADGKLTGYGGGLEIKRYLLRLEGAAFCGREE